MIFTTKEGVEVKLSEMDMFLIHKAYILKCKREWVEYELEEMKPGFPITEELIDDFAYQLWEAYLDRDDGDIEKEELNSIIKDHKKEIEIERRRNSEKAL